MIPLVLAAASKPRGRYPVFPARIMREHTRTLTPTLSLSEGEGTISMPSPPRGEGQGEGERTLVRPDGPADRVQPGVMSFPRKLRRL